MKGVELLGVGILAARRLRFGGPGKFHYLKVHHLNVAYSVTSPRCGGDGGGGGWGRVRVCETKPSSRRSRAEMMSQLPFIFVN